MNSTDTNFKMDSLVYYHEITQHALLTLSVLSAPAEPGGTVPLTSVVHGKAGFGDSGMAMHPLLVTRGHLHGHGLNSSGYPVPLWLWNILFMKAELSCRCNALSCCTFFTPEKLATTSSLLAIKFVLHPH